MTVQISEETIVLVGVIIAVFLLAMLCLAFSLNPRELVDGSVFRCCQRRNEESEEDQETEYETLNECIFEAKDEGGRQTTMEQVFPDLLGSDEPPLLTTTDLEAPLLPRDDQD